MIKEELKHFLISTQENDWLSYTDSAFNKILKESNNWTKDWSVAFTRALVRVKAGGHINQAEKAAKGRMVVFPLNKGYIMSLLFQQQKSGCVIYDFKISKRG